MIVDDYAFVRLSFRWHASIGQHLGRLHGSVTAQQRHVALLAKRRSVHVAHRHRRQRETHRSDFGIRTAAFAFQKSPHRFRIPEIVSVERLGENVATRSLLRY